MWKVWEDSMHVYVDFIIHSMQQIGLNLLAHSRILKGSQAYHHSSSFDIPHYLSVSKCTCKWLGMSVASLGWIPWWFMPAESKVIPTICIYFYSKSSVTCNWPQIGRDMYMYTSYPGLKSCVLKLCLWKWAKRMNIWALGGMGKLNPYNQYKQWVFFHTQALRNPWRAYIQGPQGHNFVIYQSPSYLIFAPNLAHMVMKWKPIMVPDPMPALHLISDPNLPHGHIQPPSPHLFTPV